MADGKRTKLEVILFIAVMVIVVIACGSSSDTQDDSECTVDKYRNSAEPIMQEFGRYIKTVDLHDPQSIKDAQAYMVTLENRAGKVACRDEYPLKHETLVYSIKHMKDYFEYFLAEDYVKADQTMKKVELNVNRFVDWTVDVP
jgi:hypothetical protein